MSNITIYINDVEPYLKEWFINEHGGEHPVHLIRGSIESNMLEIFLENKSVMEKPFVNEKTLAIYIPSFKRKDPRTYNFLPPMAKVALHKCIKNRFDVQMWQELHKFSNLGYRIDDLIYAWMEKHGIELTETNWNAIAKRYQRKRRAYIDYNSKKSKRLQEKKDSVSVMSVKDLSSEE